MKHSRRSRPPADTCSTALTGEKLLIMNSKSIELRRGDMLHHQWGANSACRLPARERLLWLGGRRSATALRSKTPLLATDPADTAEAECERRSIRRASQYKPEV